MSAPNTCWHVIRFKFKMLAESHKYKTINRADSPIHSLIANEIFGPIIRKFEREIVVWRFHRSFKPAQKSHPFTFMFYGHQGVHPKITKCIQSNDLYKKIKDEDLLELDEDQDVTCRPLSNCPAIKDDNDSSWPDEIKEIWPYYIHGVSRAWLRMIELFAEREEKDSPRDRFREKIDLYDKVNYLIEEKWVSHGEHAMLHHLNAVFGYKHINILRPHGLIRNINPVIATSGEQQVPAFLMEVCF